MKKTTKTALIVLASVCLVGYLAFQLVGFYIYKQRTCEWTNIDNIELHTRINIPSIIDCDCNYEKKKNIKNAYFTIDTNKVDLGKYIIRNEFKNFSLKTKLIFDFFNLQNNPITPSDLYYVKNSYKGENCEVILNRKTGQLWVFIQYKD